MQAYLNATYGSTIATEIVKRIRNDTSSFVISNFYCRRLKPDVPDIIIGQKNTLIIRVRPQTMMDDAFAYKLLRSSP